MLSQTFKSSTSNRQHDAFQTEVKNRKRKTQDTERSAPRTMVDLENLRLLKVPVEISVPQDESVLETVLKTTGYVLRNGAAFEERLRANEDAKFAFVKPGNEYHDYYQYLLRSAGYASELAPSRSDSEKHTTDEHIADERTSDRQRSPNNSLPREPYPFVFSSYNKGVSPRDLAVIKTTAAFCAANKDADCVVALKHRYAEDKQFGFLNPEHSLNQTFISFVNQYTQILSGELGPLTELGEDYKKTILQRSFQRAEYQEFSLELKASRKRLLEAHKIKFAAVDWENFTVVGTFALDDTQDGDVLPAPVSFAELSCRALDAGELELFAGNEAALQGTGAEETPEAGPKPSKNKKKKSIKIKAAGETRLKRSNAQAEANPRPKQIECPITHRMVPEEKFDRHLQILLSDPNYKEEREKYEAKHKLTNLTTDEVYQNIKRIARDQNAPTTGEQAHKKQRVWDGFSSSVKQMKRAATEGTGKEK